MKTERSKLILVILGAIIFNIIFWNEKPGVNIILFDSFICVSVFYLYPYSLRNTASRRLLAAHLITVAMVIINNTMLSEISFGITMLLFISFSQYIHRSALYAGASALLNYVLVIPNFFRELKSARGKNNQSVRMVTVRENPFNTPFYSDSFLYNLCFRKYCFF